MKKESSGILRFLYNTVPGRMVLKIITSPTISKIGGAYMDCRISKIHIKGFIKNNNIDMTQYEKAKYGCFNDCFTRKIKKEMRPINMEENAFIAPCDGRLSAYHISENSDFYIKKSYYSVADLIKNSKKAPDFNGGVCLVFRLCVDDYHRYIYPVSGRRSHERTINGVFHTVQPIALEHCPVYKENTRKYCIIKTKEFGTILMMEVGAMMVGRITNHEAEPGYVTRGEEKGYFEFGGSTIILLTQKGAVLPRKNILYRSARGEETRIRQGEKIGKVNNNQR